MLKKISLITVFFITVVFIIGQLPLQAGGTETVTGKVKDVDMDEKSLVLGTTAGDKVFYLEKNSQIKQGSQNKSLGDISIGMVLEVTFQTSGEDNLVVMIDISS